MMSYDVVLRHCMEGLYMGLGIGGGARSVV